MKKYQSLTFFVLIAVLVGGVLLIPTVKGVTDESSAGPTIGATIAEFRLPDINGKNQALSSLKGPNGTVIIFVSAQCPVVRAYNERMAKLAEDFGARGINVVAINANSTETVDQMKAHAADYKLSFPMLHDKGNKIADMLGAQVTRPRGSC